MVNEFDDNFFLFWRKDEHYGSTLITPKATFSIYSNLKLFYTRGFILAKGRVLNLCIQCIGFMYDKNKLRM